jgi:16S rRNA processing protein RimM
VPQEFDPRKALTAGRVLAPHGVHGEVKVEPLTDFPARFSPGSVLWLRGAPVRVARSRWQGRTVVLKLEGLDDRNAAEQLRGAELQVMPSPEGLGEGVYYRDDVIGLRVADEDGTDLGRVADVLRTGSNDVFVVRGPQGELLLPATDDVVKSVDVEAGRMVIELLPGLEWQPARKAQQRRRPARQPST